MSGDLLVCTSCLTTEEETEVDAASGLCLYCQPCPVCGIMGTGCRGEGALTVCVTPVADRKPWQAL